MTCYSECDLLYDSTETATVLASVLRWPANLQAVQSRDLRVLVQAVWLELHRRGERVEAKDRP